jgi:hypothetical protein
MVIRRKRLFWLALAGCVIGLSFIIIPPYRTYCEGHYSNDYYCAIYKILAALFSFIDEHEGAFTVLATIAIAWFTLSLRRATNELGNVSIAIADRQEKDIKILQRAYIVVEPYGIDTFVEGKDVLGYIGIRNAGRLPATQVRWFTRLTLSNSYQWNGFKDEPFEGDNILAPGTIMREGSSTVTEQDIAKITGGDGKYLYVWGTVEYFDGFDEKRATHFCHRYHWSRNRQKTVGAIVRHRIMKKYGRHHIYGNSAT